MQNATANEGGWTVVVSGLKVSGGIFDGFGSVEAADKAGARICESLASMAQDGVALAFVVVPFKG